MVVTQYEHSNNPVSYLYPAAPLQWSASMNIQTLPEAKSQHSNLTVIVSVQKQCAGVQRQYKNVSSLFYVHLECIASKWVILPK